MRKEWASGPDSRMVHDGVRGGGKGRTGLLISGVRSAAGWSCGCCRVAVCSDDARSLVAYASPPLIAPTAAAAAAAVATSRRRRLISRLPRLLQVYFQIR